MLQTVMQKEPGQIKWILLHSVNLRYVWIKINVFKNLKIYFIKNFYFIKKPALCYVKMPNDIN